MKTERRREAEALRAAILAAHHGATPTEVGERLDELRITEPYSMLNPELPGLLHLWGKDWPERPNHAAQAPRLPSPDPEPALGDVGA